MQNKLPTIKEIAKKLNISISTVSRALHDHHSIGLRTKMRVRDLANELNYEPNKTAINFKQGKTFALGVLLPNLSESFFSSAISGIEDYAGTKNYNVLLGQSHDDKEREIKIAEAMKNHRVDGMIVSVAKNTTGFEHFEALAKYNIPLVFFDRIPNMSNINFVACSLEIGMKEAVEFLLKSGHKNIALLNGPSTLLATEERLDHYSTFLKKNKIKLNQRFIVSTDLTAESTCEAMKKLLSLKTRPTAVIVFNDYVALDAIRYAKKEKIKINKDISFVSFANLPICNYMENPPLASVEQFPYLQGQKAAEMLIHLIEVQKNGTLINYPAGNLMIDSKLEIY
ncbi:MAG TPA: LacI family DNA-binding transcriptional regulator [Puia sp.]|nr:LacI family DNA-binding transcriptional regulator [Puia sp.]